MKANGSTEERADSRRNSLSRAKAISVGDLRAVKRDAFVPDMPPFVEMPKTTGGGRVILVANRLPVTVKRSNTGSYTFVPSSGGLASGVAGVLKKMDLVWYGWPGIAIPPEDEELITQRCRDEHDCIPIFLSEEVSEAHYNGFSNSILWPLFHYHPEGVSFDESAWNGYRKANEAFAKAIIPALQDNDILWVQDYHLMLLPELVRKGIAKRNLPPNNVRIGFFLHTPFPSSEIFRILPVREKLLKGVLHCELIGFHTPDYARHFISSCARVLGLPTIPSGVLFKAKYVEIKDHPIGIDPTSFYKGLDNPKIKQRIASIKKRFEGVKVIVGVDRLDYIKGVQQKLHALEVFLTEHPEWAGKVVLIQLAVPTRGDVEEYQSLRAVVNELVGRINGKFGTIEFTPINFMHRSMPQEELMALYCASDVCLVTSTRDGMNLVSYEYVACQRDQHGVLVLSEFAGAAQHLKGALIVNPWDAGSVAGALHEAVTMSDQKRHKNFAKMARVVDKRTSENWGTTFVRDIIRMTEVSEDGLKVRRSRKKQHEDAEQAVDSKVASEESSNEGDGSEVGGEGSESTEEGMHERIMLMTPSRSPPASDDV